MLSPHRANTITITIILQANVQKTAEHMDFCKVKRSLFYVEQLYDEKGTRNTLLITSKALWRFHDFHSISA
jgi:hypothetical protein